MHRLRRVVNDTEPTVAEWRSLFQCRLSCLAEAAQAWNGGVPLAAEDRVGWRAYIKRLGRDQDGSLLASVRVVDPDGRTCMLRNVRLVKERRLYV
jgi:hypothetical protein